MSSSVLEKLKNIYDFITLLSVEPALFTILFVYSLYRTPTDQLFQDKICLHTYRAPANYCTALPRMKAEDDYLQVKSKILAEVTNYSLYVTILVAIPSIVVALFIGSWTDKYQGAKKVLLVAGAVAGILEALVNSLNVYFYDRSQYFILLSVTPSAVTGGFLGQFTGIYSYISSTTPSRLRSMRMLAAELAVFAANPLGHYIGGKVLNTGSIIKQGQLHNYLLVYVIGGSAYVMSLLWILLRVNEKRDSEEYKRKFPPLQDSDDNNGSVVDHKQKQFDDNKHIHPLKLLFNFKNVSEILRTCLKRRPNQARTQIWLLFLCMLIFIMIKIGPGVFLYSFVQQVYHWNSENYTNATATGYVIQALSTLTIVPILIKVLKIQDTILALIGLTSYLAQNLIRALVLSGTGFYISLAVGALGSLISVGIRAHFSKIVEQSELGKVFSLMSAIESVAPAIASAIFSSVFKLTMDSTPGLCFYVIAGLTAIPAVVMIWIKIYTISPDKLEKERDCERVQLK